MADVSFLRTPGDRPRGTAPTGLRAAPRHRRGLWIGGGLVLALIIVLAAAAVVLKSSKATLGSDPSALAKVGMPLGGGTIEHVSVVRGRDQKPIPVKVTGDPIILPRTTVSADERYDVQVVVRRPGWLSWLTGRTETLNRTVTTPAATLRSQYVTLSRSGTLRIHFKQSVRVVSFGAKGHLTRRVLHSAQRSIALPHAGSAGTTYVAAQVQPWETSDAKLVSYFPAGTKASAVAQPKPGSTIAPETPITLSFSKPVAKVLGSHMPTLPAGTSGSWTRISAHAIEFKPTGAGYGLDAKVTIGLPSGVVLAGAGAGSNTGSWTVPAGSMLRMQQILANLGYLPLDFHSDTPVASTVEAQQVAATKPPQGTFSWHWSSTPAALKAQWQPGAYGTMTQGAIMMFENQHDMDTETPIGPALWKALLTAAVHHQDNSFGYTFVQVSELSPEHLSVWHSGKTVLSNIAVNTGVAGAATATGTYPVFEHIPVTTMIGTNVDGTKYDDPGIKWVSYFNGGDALHYYNRGSYGFPQSNGCVEMDLGDAAAVYPFTPIGALVDVQ